MHNWLLKYKKTAMLLLSSMYVTGILLLTYPGTQAFALDFTPFHLLLSAAILLAFHAHWDRWQIILLLIFSALFWGIEWTGVHTGWPFGPYHYGTVLGWAAAEIPLLIGINWIIYLYAINIVINPLRFCVPLKIILGASILVLLDFFIEPVAIHFNFWLWDTPDGQPPIQNYISWWCLSALGLTFINYRFQTANALATIFLLWQFVFFASINLIVR